MAMAMIEGAPRLMAILAHPDDESLALGGTLAKYAAEGVETLLVCATRGEVGWQGTPATDPSPLALGRMREAIARIVAEVRRVRPDVVVTFGPDGVYGHPDHVAISQLATAAVTCAADSTYDGCAATPHRVAKLYYRIWTSAEQATYEAVFGKVTIDVDGERRGWVSWPDWAVTSRLDTADHWRAVRQAVACHQSQVGGVSALGRLRPEEHRRLWGAQHFYRALTTLTTGHGVEDDLFAGLRQAMVRPAAAA